MPYAMNVVRPRAQVVLHVSGCASVDHANLWEMRTDSWDFEGNDPARNNYWIKLPPDFGRMQANEIAEAAGPLLFPGRGTRTWTVKTHTCM